MLGGNSVNRYCQDDAKGELEYSIEEAPALYFLKFVFISFHELGFFVH